MDDPRFYDGKTVTFTRRVGTEPDLKDYGDVLQNGIVCYAASYKGTMALVCPPVYNAFAGLGADEDITVTGKVKAVKMNDGRLRSSGFRRD